MKSSFLGDRALLSDTLQLLKGAAGSKLLILLSSPLLVRIYSPTDFGSLSVFNSTVLLLVPIASLRYSLALPLPRARRSAVALLALSLTLPLIFSTLIGISIWMWGGALSALLGVSASGGYALLVTVSVALVATYDTLMMWATRHGDFRLISRTQVSQSIVGLVVKVGLGLMGVKPLGLLLGQSLQQGGGVVSMLFRLNRRDFAGNSILGMIAVAKRYSSFPIYRLPSQFLLVFSTQVPVLIFASAYTTHATGQFGLAISTIGVPMALVAQTVSNAFYRHIAKLGKSNTIAVLELSRRLFSNMILIALVPVMVIFLGGPWLFSLVFGGQWIQAGEFARMLVLPAGLQMVAAPLMHLYNLFENHGAFLRTNLWRSLVVSSVLFFCAKAKFTESDFVLSLSIVSSLLYIGIIVGSFATMREKRRSSL